MVVNIKSFEFKLKWEIEIFLWLLFYLLLLLFLVLSFLGFQFLSLFYLNLENLSPLLHDLSPIFIYLFWLPWLNLYPRYSLHPKYSHARVITTNICIRHPLNNYLVLGSAVMDHRVDRWEFFRAFRTFEMLGFLMMMQNDLVFEMFVAVEAKRSQTSHISLSSSHCLYLYYKIVFKYFI